MDDWEDYMSRSDEGAGLLVLLLGVVFGLFFWGVVVALIWVYTSTGPGCPGMDPEWVGWCRATE